MIASEGGLTEATVLHCRTARRNLKKIILKKSQKIILEPMFEALFFTLMTAELLGKMICKD